MPRLWHIYFVTEVSMDMLRYEGAYVKEIPEQTDFAKRHDDITLYVGGTVYSPNPPLVSRWKSFGIGVRDVARITKPTGKMFTCERPEGMSMGAVGWVEEEL